MEQVAEDFLKFCTGRCSECEFEELPAQAICGVMFGYKIGKKEANDERFQVPAGL